MATPFTDTIAGFVLFGTAVLGAGHSYNLATFFDAQNATPSTVVLPTLLAFTPLTEHRGWTTQAMMGGAPKLEFMVEHHYLYKLVAGESNYAHIAPGVEAAMDAYYTALNADPMLITANGGTKPISHMPLVVRPRQTRVDWFGTVYHAVVFQYDIELNL